MCNDKCPKCHAEIEPFDSTDNEAAAEEADEAEIVRLLECGCCGEFHPEGELEPGGSANYQNDCRFDANRFASAEEYEARMGKKAVEVWLDEQEPEA